MLNERDIIKMGKSHHRRRDFTRKAAYISAMTRAKPGLRLSDQKIKLVPEAAAPTDGYIIAITAEMIANVASERPVMLL